MILHDNRHLYDFSKNHKNRRRFIRPIRDRMPYLPLAPLKPETLPNWKRIDYGAKHTYRFRIYSRHPPTHAPSVASGPVQCRPVPSNPASASCVHLSPAMFCMSRVCVMGSSPSHMDVSDCRFPRGFTGAWRAGGAWPESQTGAWPESTGAWPDKSISKIKIKESKKQKNIKK